MVTLSWRMRKQRAEKPSCTWKSCTQCLWERGLQVFLTSNEAGGSPIGYCCQGCSRLISDFYFQCSYFLSAQDLGKSYTLKDPFLSFCAWCVSTYWKYGEPKLAGLVGEGVSPSLLENRVYQLPTFWVLLWFRIPIQGLVFTSYSSSQEWVFPCI